MQLSKDAFEAALNQDRANLGVVQTASGQQDANKKNNLFGPQTNLQGMPLQNNIGLDQGVVVSNPNKEKTRRELMWEQRLQAN